MSKMPVTNLHKLLSVCKVEDVPACRKGIKLAANFLAACGRAVELIDLEESAALMDDFNTKFSLFSSHHVDCPRCREAMK
jgi:hypothetical protein